MALPAETARRAHVAFQRFGLGARGGGLADIGRDPRAALLAEVDAPRRLLIEDAQLASGQAALARYFEQDRAENQLRRMSPDDRRETATALSRLSPEARAAIEAERRAQQTPSPAEVQQQEALARIRKAAEPMIGFAERLVLFWSNHFAVSAGKGPLGRVSAGAFEREAIRPHVFGRFSDMLLAVEKHPAMLFYLDNRQSVGSNSRVGRNRRLGLNENLAREILELHTLGVDGGYAQEDVTSLARIITGWTFAGGAGFLGEPGAFVFSEDRHEPGAHVLLGKTYAEDGLAQGERALGDLARHPSTARHLARKLARHFVSAEDPPQRLVDRLAAVFRQTEGDLAAVSRALVSSEDAWAGDLSNIRTPYEHLAAIARIAGPPTDGRQVVGPLAALAQPLWTPPGPNGFSDAPEHWMGPDAMRRRLDVTAGIARRIGDRFNPVDLARALFDAALSTETEQAVRRAESKPQGLAILFMSPEFLRR